MAVIKIKNPNYDGTSNTDKWLTILGAPEVVNDLTTGGYSKALSAEQGLVLARTKVDEAPSDSNQYVRINGTWSALTIPNSSPTTPGLVRTGYTTNDKNYAVSADENTDLYVNVPWTDTTYISGTGIQLSGTTISLATSGVTSGTYGPSENVTGSNGTTVSIPSISVDSYGRITSITDLTYTSVDTTYTAGTGISISGTTINHESSITAGTAGTSSSTSGTTTLDIPYVTYNATGHITAAGTHTHTISTATTSESGLMSNTDKAKVDMINSYTTATTIASLNTSYNTIYVNLSANASLSASGTGASYNGYSITAYVYTSSARTITIPTSGSYVSMCGSSFTTTAGGWVEFSLVCIEGIWHIAKLEME